MLPGPCYIVSDLHLGVGSPEIERSFLRFVRFLHGRAGSLLINGDLWDFWFEWRRAVPRVGFRAAAALADLRESGVPITFLAGNHDCWGGDVLRNDVGLDYRLGEWRGEIAGWRSRIAHGDGLRGRGDRGYRMLRRVLRNRVSIAAFRLLPPDFGTALAAGTSQASKTYRPVDGGAELRDVALRALAAEPALDLYVLGHSHVAALEKGSAGGVYGNAGSWLDAMTFLRVTTTQVELMEWSGSAEGNRLNAIDRRS